MRGFGALELQIPSDVGEIAGVVTAVVQWCADCAVEGRQLTLNLPVALTEALSNAILRGNGEDARKLVVVRGRCSELEVVVEVEDQGGGFDLAACTADPTTPENLEREDGRGLYLMQALMDRVERESAGEAAGVAPRNIVRLVMMRTRGHAA